jgi:hypothetical protein
MSAILTSKNDDEEFIKRAKLNEADAKFIREMRGRLEKLPAERVEVDPEPIKTALAKELKGDANGE